MNSEINASELIKILDITPSTQNVMIMGRHGIGKSEILKDYFESKGKKFVAVFCSQAADPGDIIGLPYKDEKTLKTEYALPWWFPTDDTPVVIFLDELNRARPEILQVIQDLTLNRRLAGKSLPPGSQIVAAINNGDEYQITDLDPALVSRFNVYDFKPSVKDWILWANKHGINNSVIMFIASNNKYLDEAIKEDDSTLTKTGDRRAWVKVSDIMNNNPTFDIALKKCLCGIVGPSAGVSFYEYARKTMTITPYQILSDFDSVENKVAAYTLTEFTAMNDSICSWIDSEYDDKVLNSSVLCENLVKYMGCMIVNNREGMSHLISNFESGSYPMFNALIAENPDTLGTVIEAYIEKMRIK